MPAAVAKYRTTLLFVLLPVMLVAAVLGDVLLGSVALSPADVWDALAGQGDDTVRSIVLKFRIPKAVVAVLSGAALSASGLQMQTLFRNPLAGPYVLGVSSGASLGVSLFLLGLPLMGGMAASELVRGIGMAGAAWAGGALVLLVVMAVSARVKDIMVILILGMMFGSATGAVVDILQFLSDEGALKSYVVWTMGSLGGVGAGQLKIMAAVVAVGLAMSVALIKPLDMLLLGESYARTMGMDVTRTRRMIFVSTTLLAATVTAFCGPIGFIGIAMPHVARMMFARAGHRILMPGSMLVGALVMVVCDVVAQMPGYDMVIPINTITALLGIPIIIVVIVRNRKIF